MRSDLLAGQSIVILSLSLSVITEASDSGIPELQNASNATSSPGTSNSTSAHRYSNATVVPAVTSVALLGGYATVEAFNTTERARVN